MGNLKVGDKVRSLVTQIDVRAGELYEVKTVDDGDVWVIDDVGDHFYLTADEFEILPVVAESAEDKSAFKIEAGKYYRTRDGRKVGPIENRKREDAEHPFIWNWPDGRGNRIYKPDGTNYSDRNDDLIAEWVDEPVKAAAPVAVQQDAPELTVKLSFDAADVTNAIKSTLLKTNQGYGFEIARHGDYVWVDTGKKAPIVLKATDVQAAA
ncbi:hypothetical protein LQT97_14915 [Brucella pseudogrignonensis]|uniref:hypothetical protein n=1 Tax=Brucella pseudogrignonensis TaxID=419475 RepID=UPI001E4591D4|nr:hypothetical protein [Brucella pseudogrignonensis]MCD4512516.1 hypothetical protein [Brucella pseudogrignonensis]